MALTDDDMKQLAGLFDKTFQPVQADISGLRDELRQMRGELKEIDSKVNRVSIRASALEAHIKANRGDTQALRGHLDDRFDELATHIDGLVKTNETREQENVAIKHQLEELEKQSA